MNQKAPKSENRFTQFIYANSTVQIALILSQCVNLLAHHQWFAAQIEAHLSHSLVTSGHRTEMISSCAASELATQKTATAAARRRKAISKIESN